MILENTKYIKKTPFTAHIAGFKTVSLLFQPTIISFEYNSICSEVGGELKK